LIQNPQKPHTEHFNHSFPSFVYKPTNPKSCWSTTNLSNTSKLHVSVNK